MNQFVKLNSRPNTMEVDTTQFTTEWLKENETFNYLVSQVELWNEEVREADVQCKKIYKAIVRNNLFKHLGSQLQEVASTSDRHTQLKFLESVMKWFDSQRNILLSKGP